MVDPVPPQEARRKQLVWDSLTGFIGFFAFLSVVQAILNLLQPEPQLWPAVLALVTVIATVALWKAGKKRYRSTPENPRR